MKMAYNPNTIPPPSLNNLFHTPSKPPQVIGNQGIGNYQTNSPNPHQPMRNPSHIGQAGVNAYINPNGLTNSPSPVPSYAPQGVRSMQPNNVYHNNSSLDSSRNSSPAMNHSGISPSPIPPSQYPPQVGAYRPSLSRPAAGPVKLPESNAASSARPDEQMGSSELRSPPTKALLSSNSLSQLPVNPSDASSFQPLAFPQSQPNIPNLYQTSKTNAGNPSPVPLSVNRSIPTSTAQPQANSYPPPPLNNQNKQPLIPPGPASLPFPGRQINSNMPPLATSQMPVAQSHLNARAYPPPSVGAVYPKQMTQAPPMNENNHNLPPSTLMKPPQNISYPSNVNAQSQSGANRTYPPNNQASYPPTQTYPPAAIPEYQYSQNATQPNYPPTALPPSYPPTLQQPPASSQYQQHQQQQQQHQQQPPHPSNQQFDSQNLYNGQSGLTQQMGRLNVTQNSFSRMWGHETVDLMQCRNVIPEGKLEPPIVKLNHQFAQSANCSPDIFRCTLSKIPETNNLLQKSRLPLGILIHPFKDLNHLPVIQCSAIVRCRACRTYINPFVYFVDLKRWKCNLCYRVNELPEEFQYDPVTKSYGDPTRRPEIQSATIEYIAPSEYMLRPPQPAAYLFLLDVSAAAAESGYLQLFCNTLKEQIESLPGDSRTQLAFICFDSAVHFYFLGEEASRPREMTVIDIEEIFLPSPEDLLVNLAERRASIIELLTALPARHAAPSPSATQSALGAALQAAHKLMAPTGGRITIFQTCLPNVGPGGLTPREDPNNRSSKEVAHLNPATDFYKRLALECSGVQVAVDLFLLNSQYADLSTLSGISRFSGGSVYHMPLFKATREWQAAELQRCLTRYLTRKIGFEAVMRVRCTRGLSIHTFHGSFFVRSTDLLSLPNVSPDAGFGMQLSIEESLSDVQHVCFQAALLYTSSKGERRIRVHTLCLPVVSTLPEVIHSADQQCITGLLAKMAVDRSQTSSLSDAREALINAAVDALGAQKLSGGPAPGLVAPMTLRLLPLYLLALLKHPAFRTGTSTRLDDRVAAMCNMKSLPLGNLMRAVYPDLYPIHNLVDYTSLPPAQPESGSEAEVAIPAPPRLQLSAEKVNSTGAYLLDKEDTMLIYIGHGVDPKWLFNTLGVNHHSYIGDDRHMIPTLKTEENTLLHAFIDHLNDDRPHAAAVHVIADNAPNRTLFTEKLLDDRVESALSYYEFLQHIKSQIK